MILTLTFFPSPPCTQCTSVLYTQLLTLPCVDTVCQLSVTAYDTSGSVRFSESRTWLDKRYNYSQYLIRQYFFAYTNSLWSLRHLQLRIVHTRFETSAAPRSSCHILVEPYSVKALLEEDSPRSPRSPRPWGAILEFEDQQRIFVGSVPLDVLPPFQRCILSCADTV